MSTRLQVSEDRRATVVLAYAHAMMFDLLTDFALEPAMSAKLPAQVADLGEANEIGWIFEETFLQGHAERWTISEEEGKKVRAEAIECVDRWLASMNKAKGV
jgi:hypothetical protein